MHVPGMSTFLLFVIPHLLLNYTNGNICCIDRSGSFFGEMRLSDADLDVLDVEMAIRCSNIRRLYQSY